MKINKLILVILIFGLVIVGGLMIWWFLTSGVEEIPEPPPLPDEVSQQTNTPQGNTTPKPTQNITEGSRKSGDENVAFPKPPQLPQ